MKNAIRRVRQISWVQKMHEKSNASPVRSAEASDEIPWDLSGFVRRLHFPSDMGLPGGSGKPFKIQQDILA